jgi:two-component system, OmpR family, sensor histidine kinase KdpD
VPEARVARRPARGYVIAGVAVGIATVVGLIAAPYASHADQAMVYLLTILVAALGGRGPGLTAAVLSAAAFDFFFVEPYHTFAVADRSFLITFGVMLAIGVAIGSLVNRIRIAEAESRERELRAKAEQLRATLLSSVSHDLRTPLAVITGMATSLRDGADGEQREELDTIVDEAQRLSRILTNLLSITKVEGGAEPKREWVPLDELVGSSLARLDAELADHPLTLDVADELAHVDPMLFDQLLVNLVENAAKHTPAGCAISVRARRDGNAALIDVSDFGPGLPPGPPDQVFGKFFRGRGVKAGGVGLGLTVCRAIAVAHGGRIEAAAGPSGGAIFRVWFPDDGAPPQLADEPEATQEADARPEDRSRSQARTRLDRSPSGPRAV